MKKNSISEFQQIKNMFKTINLIKEQNDIQYQNQLNNRNIAHQDGSENSEKFNVDGDYIVIHSHSDNIELSDEIRSAFQTTKDEFGQQVTDLLEFGELHLHDMDVEWSGRLTKFDMEFFYMLGSKENGVFIKGDMIKVDEEFITVVGQLTEYYKTFTQKWSPIISSHNKQENDTNTI